MRNDLTQFAVALGVLGLIAVALGVLAATLLIVNDAVRGYLRERAAEQRLTDLRARHAYQQAEQQAAQARRAVAAVDLPDDVFESWPVLDTEPAIVFPRRRAA